MKYIIETTDVLSAGQQQQLLDSMVATKGDITALVVQPDLEVTLYDDRGYYVYKSPAARATVKADEYKVKRRRRNQLRKTFLGRVRLWFNGQLNSK